MLNAPAKRAGILVGDVIYDVANKLVLTLDDLNALVRRYHAQDAVDVLIKRSAQS